MKELARPAVTIPVTVEFEEVDSFRIAHHTKLVAYLERARLRLLASLGVELEGRGPAPVIYELELRFRKPAKLLDQLDVSAWLNDVDDYRVTLGYRIRCEGETILRATSVIAFADLESGALTPVPASIRLGIAASKKESEG